MQIVPKTRQVMAGNSKGTTIRITILSTADTVEYISNSCQEKRPPRLSYNKMFFNVLTIYNFTPRFCDINDCNLKTKKLQSC